MTTDNDTFPTVVAASSALERGISCGASWKVQMPKKARKTARNDELNTTPRVPKSAVDKRGAVLSPPIAAPIALPTGPPTAMPIAAPATPPDAAPVPVPRLPHGPRPGLDHRPPPGVHPVQGPFHGREVHGPAAQGQPVMPRAHPGMRRQEGQRPGEAQGHGAGRHH